MKKNGSLYLAIIFAFGLIIFQVGNKTTEANAEQDLKTMVSKLKDEHILITDWSLYTREVLENASVDQIVSKLKAEFPEWSWVETDEGYKSTTASVDYTEEIEVTSSQFDTYIMYEVQGQSWDGSAEAFYNEKWPKRIADIFHGNSTTFSCVKGEISDKMDKSLSSIMTRLLAAFNAEKIEALEEETFISTSAYSPKFSSMLSEDHEMNVQLGLRKPNGMGGNTTLVVGTPIITIEY